MAQTPGIGAQTRRLVRITGERNGFVEFEYGVGDLAMALELMLPPHAFAEFCEANRAEVVEGDVRDDMSAEQRAMAWRPSDVQRQI